VVLAAVQEHMQAQALEFLVKVILAVRPTVQVAVAVVLVVWAVATVAFIILKPAVLVELAY
jgi:hypothetical protein